MKTAGISKRIKRMKLTPPRILAVIFLILIAIGTLLLKLPFATAEPISWLTAFFTATSASTVTGLIVVDTGIVFTRFGQIVILCLIQAGGLGIMTFAVSIVLILGRRIGIRYLLVLQQALNQASLGGIINLIKVIMIFSFTIEFIVACLLLVRFVPLMGWGEGIYASVFHAISAFNNAGFSIWPDNLMGFVGDPYVNILISFLFIIGGLGFTVVVDVYYSRSYRKLSLHSKLMLIGTVVVNSFAVLFIFWMEFDNPATMGNMVFGDKMLSSYFQGVTPRTAGFNTLNIGDMEESSLSLMMILMFIGAGSTSTGGGIKLTTFIALSLSVIMFLRGKDEAVIFHRTIKNTIIIKALAITIVSLAALFTAIFILVIVEKEPFLTLLFEAISAFGTVGISMGITDGLSGVGRIVIIFLMIFGKLGPLTLLFSLTNPLKSNIRYPRGDLITG